MYVFSKMDFSTWLTNIDDNGKNISLSSGANTFDDWHTYTIDWKPDQLDWYIDGSNKRTLKKSDTFNKTDNQYHYPQTPSRVQLSLWPAGISKNGKGTVEWAGGLIDWNAQDVKQNGYYYSMFKEVDIECYQAPSDAAFTSGNTSYVYVEKTGVEKSIAVTGNDTVLKSLLGTGTDKDKDYPNSKPSGTTKSSSPAATSEVATIPGLSGAGPGTDGSRGGADDDSSGSGSGSDNGPSGSATSGGSGASSTGVGGFSQGNQKGTSNAMKVEGMVAGSMVAALMALAGMLIL